MNPLRMCCLVLMALVLATGCTPALGPTAPLGTDGSPKYVILFIGDGMGLAQAHATEIYLSAVRNSADMQVRRDSEGRQWRWFRPGAARLTMNRFPVIGLATTYSANAQITDSAAAGTALATGRKTSNGTISMDENDTLAFASLAELAKARGMKVGIVSSTSTDDATPAVFYAHQDARAERRAIDLQLAASPFDYFAGSELAKPPEGQPTAAELAARAGFRVATTREELAACRPGQRVLFESRLPYEIDRPSHRLTLSELAAKGLELLDNPRGFFMMVEGGKIDGGGHTHDARVMIDEVLALDEAVRCAVEFYERHPLETLIVITSDHETGGLILGGNGGSKSELGLASLAAQQQSWQAFNFEIFAPFKAAHKGPGAPPASENIPAELKQAVHERFGLDIDALSATQKARLEDAYDASLSLPDPVPGKPPRIHPLYGTQEPFPLTVAEVVSQRAGLTWATFGHTALPVPVRALGAGAYRFGGCYDNTDVALRLAEALQVQFPPPQTMTPVVPATSAVPATPTMPAELPSTGR